MIGRTGPGIARCLIMLSVTKKVLCFIRKVTVVKSSFHVVSVRKISDLVVFRK